MASTGHHIMNWLEFLLARLPGGRRFGIPFLFAVVSAPVFLMVVFLVVRAEQNAATQILVDSTEIQNANLARTMANTHFDKISYLLALDIGDAPELLPIAIRRSGLDTVVRDSLKDTNIFNMKLYDEKGVTLFSLDQSQLGENVSACVCFAHALTGTTTSELIRLGDVHHGLESAGAGSVHDGHGHGTTAIETGVGSDSENASAKTTSVSHVRGDVDVLTTMIRISVLASDLVASDSILEIQSDVTKLLTTVDAARGEVLRTVGIPLFVLYITVVLIVLCVRLLVLRRENEARALALRVAESEASNQAKSEFLSLMSHELRTPLNAIIGFSQLIEQNEQDDDSSETANYARTIHESGHHMLRQIISILDMTAIELGKLDLDAVPVSLEGIAREAAKNVLPTFDRGLVTLNVLDTMTLPLVQGDRTKLCQVFENLLTNAARFTPAGGQVDLIFGTEPGGWVCVGIKDTGVGMTREQIDRARLPFKHDWNGLSREADGAGLGLTIADRIVTQLGGELVIDSDKDVGTKVIVRLREVAITDGSDDRDDVPVMMAAE